MNCQHCNRSFSNPGALGRHVPHCHSNPNYVKAVRSPKAGQKKGCKSWNKGQKTGRLPVWDEKFPLEKVMTKNSTYSRTHLRKRIIDNNLIPYRCAICAIGPEWQGKPMPLILDHINGVNDDHRISNLRFVCSNCDCQLPTYKSKNRSKEGTEVGSSHSLENCST
jgi:hypothetical protein